MARPALTRIGEALALAIAAGASAVIAPPLALLVLAGLAARLALSRSIRAPVRVLDSLAPCAAALGVGLTLGLAAGVGMAFVWRIVADARWSMQQAARHAALDGATLSPGARAHLWLTPAFGLAMVAYTAPHMVAGLPLDLPHVPVWVPALCGAAAALALFDWLIRIAAEWRIGALNPTLRAHEAAHHAIFLGAYAAAQDISAGLVALIAWRIASAARPQASFTAVP